MNLNSYALPLSYRAPLYNQYTSPLGYLGYGGYTGYNEAYLNGLRNVNNAYLGFNPYEYDQAKRYNATKTKYSYYQPELYKTSYNYTNPYPSVYPYVAPLPSLTQSQPATQNKTNKNSLPSIPGVNKTKTKPIVGAYTNESKRSRKFSQLKKIDLKKKSETKFKFASIGTIRKYNFKYFRGLNG